MIVGGCGWLWLIAYFSIAALKEYYILKFKAKSLMDDLTEHWVYLQELVLCAYLEVIKKLSIYLFILHFHNTDK